MDFWGAYEKRRGNPDFGRGRLWLRTGDRPNASALRLVERAAELKSGEAAIHTYSPERRYLVARDIVSDLLILLYDVNSQSAFAARPTGPVYSEDIERISKTLRAMRNPKLEVRLIGLQNNDTSFIESIERLHRKVGHELSEIDLFGNERRHVIIDMLTGKPYSLLLENRIYRPGELVVMQAPSPKPAGGLIFS